MATIQSLSDRVRLELGDLGKTFVSQLTADGTTSRFRIGYSPLDASTLVVTLNGTDISDNCTVEEGTGILITPTIPAEGAAIVISGTYFRYFTGAEMATLVQTAIDQHTSTQTDTVGRKLTLSTLPVLEEYPVAIYAVTLALYTLATDASFDIDISAPDGVTIPRSERYRQLMEMVQTRQTQYRELCALLGIGLYGIDVFTLRRISKATGRYIPVYRPQEVDDRSYPDRVDLKDPTYGDVPPAWPTDAGELTAYQGRSFSTSLDFTGNYAGKSFTARLLNQRGSVLAVRTFTLSVDVSGIDVITAAARTAGSTTITITTSAAHGLTDGASVAITDVDATVNGIGTIATIVNATQFTITGTATTALALTGLTGQVDTNVSKDYTFTLSLTKDETLLLAERTYWSLSTVDSFTAESIEIKGGKFFTVRRSTVVI